MKSYQLLKKVSAASLVLAVLAACSTDNLPRHLVLQSLRVVALTLDNPEVNFDGSSFSPSTVNLSPWISDLYGAGRPLSMNVYACLDPGIGSGITPSCSSNTISSSTLTQVMTGQSVALSSTFLAPNYTGQLSSVSIPLTGIATTLQAAIAQKLISFSGAQSFNGYSILVFFELYPTADTTQKITTFKRLVFSGSSKTTKNQNPSGLIVRLNGTEISSLPTSDSNLDAYVTNDQAETYSQMDSFGTLTTLTEKLDSAWFITGPKDVPCSNKKECNSDGYLALAFTNIGQANPFYIPQVSKVTGRGRVLISVMKDDRGGNTVKRYCDGTCP